MQRVYKYVLEVKDEQMLVMPRGAKPLRVDAQDGKWCLWALVETDWPAAEYQVRIAGTGHAIMGDFGPQNFINTFFALDGALVFHAFVSGPIAR